MKQALEEARKAYQANEVPIGAVMVKDGKIVSHGYNRRETSNDPTAHAEMIAIREASLKEGHWRLKGVSIYVTLEPCPMCAGALVQARVERLVYGASDPKAGAVESLYRIATDERLNHRLQVKGGVMQKECAELLSSFFKSRR